MKATEQQKNKYYLIENYTMKCRLYPNKEIAKKIDNAIYGVQCFHNCVLYQIFNEFKYTTEKKKKSKDKETSNDIVHFLNSYDIGKAETKNKLIEEHPIIDAAPSGAIIAKCGVKTDIIKSIGKNPIEYQKPSYYSKKNPRMSYSYQETFSKITTKDNQNVLYIDLAKIGICKIRGWNKNIRFDEYGLTDFIEYIKLNKNKKVTVIISKDNCNDYWICFKLQNVYKQMPEQNGKSIGIDVGLKDICIISDGTKYENKKFKQKEQKHSKILNRKLSRRQGWANEKFRLAYKSDKNLVPSKKYERTKLKLSKLHRKIARKRNLYNNQITTNIVKNNGFIGVETLNVSGMFRNKHLSNALSDAAMSSVLSMLSYKSIWYDRIIQPINQWTPSSKRCSNCGYILPSLTLSVREWTCPECNTHHDRDINAAKNIKYFAIKEYTGQTT